MTNNSNKTRHTHTLATLVKLNLSFFEQLYVKQKLNNKHTERTHRRCRLTIPTDKLIRK